LYQKNDGMAHLDLSVPVSDSTLFPIFSCSKIFSVMAIHQLIQTGKLRLDQNIQDLLAGLPQKWKGIQIQHLLSHSLGLTDIYAYRADPEKQAAEKVYQADLQFSPGERFAYNQSNYWFLSRIVKKKTRLSLTEYVLNHRFDKGSKSVLFEGNPRKIVKNQATMYDDFDQAGILCESTYDIPPYTYGASGMAISLAQFIAWDQKLIKQRWLPTALQTKLLKPFPYQQINFPEDYDFSYGLSLIRHQGEWTYGFTGSAASAYRHYPKRKLSSILLANGMFTPRGEGGGIDEVVNGVADILNIH
ncbi:MAG: serine hydrolase domain-containing protein, partial [Bacteroidota bacterium]